MAEASTGPGRREARERAVALLYECEAKGVAAPDLLATLPLSPDAYAEAAVRGVHGSMGDVDAEIVSRSVGWRIERLPAVDRAILRLAIWELTNRQDVPSAVILNEAVELAKAYSTEKSPAFVNGVLDAVAAEVREG